MCADSIVNSAGGRRQRVRRTLIIVLSIAVVSAYLAAFAGSASAAGAKMSWSERQTIPGLTERTIWGRGQVYVYRLPANVTHTGDLHVEISYAPADCDCFVYLLGPVAQGSAEWQVCPGTYSQGFLSLVPGREVVDYQVPQVLDQTPTADGVVGDAYYAVVQAASGASHVQLTGYLPKIRAGQTDTTSELTFTRLDFRAPTKAKASITVSGAPYGGPFDVTPTSEGQVECRLQYPADVAHRTVAAATGELPAAFEQYVYPPLWEPEGGSIPLSQTISYANWDLYDANRHAAAPLAGDDWYGLQGGFAVQAAGQWKPLDTYHYVPVLWLAAAQPHAHAPAQPGPPATGLQTVGYKATLLVPERLRLASVAAKARKRSRVKLSGTLAVASGSGADAALQWAAPGTVITVQRKAGSAWAKAGSTRTGANGSWRLKVRVVRTTDWRAVAQPAPGQPAEYSVIKRTVVRR
jgi:hypothetical protein